MNNKTKIFIKKINPNSNCDNLNDNLNENPNDQLIIENFKQYIGACGYFLLKKRLDKKNHKYIG